MKRKSLVLLLGVSFIISCAPAVDPTVYPTPSSYPSASADYARPQAYPSAAASAAPTAMSANDLSSLRAGVIPEASFSEEEKKLAGFLVRKTK
ncbi:MAG: hypothetical protein AABZ74_06545, partial [Cyanobacteriota bacterium]